MQIQIKILDMSYFDSKTVQSLIGKCQTKLSLRCILILTSQPLIRRWSTSLHPKVPSLGLLPIDKQKKYVMSFVVALA